MKTLKRTLVTLSPEERGMFAVFHSEQKCYGRSGKKVEMILHLTLLLSQTILQFKSNFLK